MDTREISKNVTRIMQQIESAEENITLGMLDTNLAKLYKDLRKFQNKCPHQETYELGTETFCDICHKKL